PILRYWLGKRYEHFIVRNMQRYGMSRNPWLLILVWVPLLLGTVVAVPAGVTALWMGYHIRFSEDEIGVAEPFWPRERIYGFGRVPAGVQSPHFGGTGGTVAQDGYFVHFDDGRTERLHFYRTVEPDEGRRLMEFVCARTGKPLHVVQFPNEAKAFAV